MSKRLTAGMLLSTTDASVWAREFCAIAEELGHEGIDEGWMIGWFANAMAAQEMAMASQVQPADFRRPEQEAGPSRGIKVHVGGGGVVDCSEQPKTPDPQSSEGESTETMVEAVADAIGEPPLHAYDRFRALNPSATNGTTHPEQQEDE